MSEIDLEKIEKDWRARRFSFGLWVDPPGQTWEDYIHATDELFMVLEGDVELEVAGKIVHPEPGQEIRITAHTRHSVRNRGGTESRWLYGYRI